MEKLTSDDHQLMRLTLELKDDLPTPMQMLRRPVALRTLLNSVGNDVEKARAELAQWRTEYSEDVAFYHHSTKGLDEYLIEQVWQTKVQSMVSTIAADSIVTVPGPRVIAQPIPASFPGSAPVRLLRNSCGINLSEDWASSWMTKAKALFAAKSDSAVQDFDAFLTSGQSNGREMSWTIISIPPNRSFPLHAHPSIEVIYIAKGVMHEVRLRGEAPTRDFGADLVGPDLSSDGTSAFIHNAVSQGEMLANEVGSVHQSYTKDEGCVLLCLWSSAHADIPCSHMPKTDLLKSTVVESTTVVSSGSRSPSSGEDVKYTCT
jgi:hypothetical protein